MNYGQIYGLINQTDGAYLTLKALPKTEELILVNLLEDARFDI